MKKEILTRCGYRCDLCLAYAPNVRQSDDRVRLSTGWKEYFRLEVPPDRIVCDGCLSRGAPRLLDAGCPVRPCVIGKGLENCGQCGRMPCSRLRQRIVDAGKIETARGAPIPRADRRDFIRPYENRARLEAVRDRFHASPRLLNPLLEPDGEMIERFAGRAAGPLHSLRAWLLERYGLEGTVGWSGTDYGWSIGYRAGSKPLCTIFPERHGFAVVVILGGKEQARFRKRRADFTPAFAAEVEGTRRFHDGQWVLARPKGSAGIADIRRMILLKKNPRPASQTREH